MCILYLNIIFTEIIATFVTKEKKKELWFRVLVVVLTLGTNEDAAQVMFLSFSMPNTSRGCIQH